MDDDGSGAIDIDELGAAFKLLGFRLKRQEIVELVAEVDDGDGGLWGGDRGAGGGGGKPPINPPTPSSSGELQYPEFLEVMTATLHRLAEDKNHNNGGQIPFALMATAYRRKKLLEDVLENTAESLANVVQAGIDEKERERDKEVSRQKERGEAGGMRDSFRPTRDSMCLNPQP